MYNCLNIGDILYVDNSVAYIINMNIKDSLGIDLKFISFKDIRIFQKYINEEQRSTDFKNLTMSVNRRLITSLINKKSNLNVQKILKT